MTFRVCTSLPPGRTVKSILPGDTPTLNASADEAASAMPIIGSKIIDALASLPVIAHF